MRCFRMSLLSIRRIPGSPSSPVVCPKGQMSSGFGDADEIARLVQYLRIRSVQPTPDYAACVNFLVKLADELQLAHRVHYFNDKPLLVMTRQGTEPALPSILLTSHMDVVPVTAVPFPQTCMHHRHICV